MQRTSSRLCCSTTRWNGWAVAALTRSKVMSSSTESTGTVCCDRRPNSYLNLSTTRTPAISTVRTVCGVVAMGEAVELSPPKQNCVVRKIVRKSYSCRQIFVQNCKMWFGKLLHGNLQAEIKDWALCWKLTAARRISHGSFRCLSKNASSFPAYFFKPRLLTARWEGSRPTGYGVKA